MLQRVLLVGDDPNLARTFGLAAAGLLVLAALLIVGTWGLDAADAPGPSHATLLLALQAVVGVGVVLAAVNGYLGGGLLVSAWLAVAPTLAIAAGMLVGPALGITTGDASPTGALALAGYFLLLATVLGIGGFAVGAILGWLVELVPA